MQAMAERTLSSSRPFEGKLISVRVDEVELQSGGRARREIVEHPGAVAMLAWDGERLGMVHQWRQAAGGTMLEIPAGTMERGEQPLETARRELAEEIGMAAADWLAGPSFFTAPGFCTEYLSLFLATGLTDADPGSTPDEEEIEVEWLGLDDALRAIDDGRVVDAKSVAGILWLARRLAPG
jgi:ADP-ribose pyrophosphatase